MMLKLWNSLRGGGAGFYPFERRILDDVKSRLDAESGAQLQRQIDAINRIQRLSDGKEVNLYQMLHCKPVFDDSLRFPYAADETLLASINLVGADKPTKLKVEVWLVEGRLFALVFNKPPKQFFAGLNLKAVQPEIADVKIWFDPMRPPAVEKDKPVDASALTGWLHQWYVKGRVSGLHAPLAESERAQYLARTDAQLPPDYLELVAQTEGTKLAGCVVYGVTGIRHIVWPEANYYMLAEIEGLGAVAVKEGGHNAELYLLHYEDDAQPLGTSFQNAIADLLKPD